jgi:hypothetical protein
LCFFGLKSFRCEIEKEREESERENEKWIETNFVEIEARGRGQRSGKRGEDFEKREGEEESILFIL